MSSSPGGVPLVPAPGRTVAWRALMLRCPRCGGGHVFAGWFRMREACPACGFRFEREPGYFVGAIYVNYAITAAVALGGTWLLDDLIGLSLRTQLALAIGLALLCPVAFFHLARAVWLAVDHVVTRALDGGGTPRR